MVNYKQLFNLNKENGTLELSKILQVSSGNLLNFKYVKLYPILKKKKYLSNIYNNELYS